MFSTRDFFAMTIIIVEFGSCYKKYKSVCAHLLHCSRWAR